MRRGLKHGVGGKRDSRNGFGWWDSGVSERPGRNDECESRIPFQGESFQRIWESVHRNDEVIFIYVCVSPMNDGNELKGGT
jgi:hypothetical protein